MIISVSTTEKIGNEIKREARMQAMSVSAFMCELFRIWKKYQKETPIDEEDTDELLRAIDNKYQCVDAKKILAKLNECIAELDAGYEKMQKVLEDE
ncbi:MAG: hypothetical protein H6824_01175 [Planctomycetaceae bacterium]|nr:hypothetical protein [Planctomycetaceae bacterium]